MLMLLYTSAVVLYQDNIRGGGTSTRLLTQNVFGSFHRYTFSKVLPGNYDIIASHPSWTLEQVSFFLYGS